MINKSMCSSGIINSQIVTLNMLLFLSSPFPHCYELTNGHDRYGRIILVLLQICILILKRSSMLDQLVNICNYNICIDI